MDMNTKQIDALMPRLHIYGHSEYSMDDIEKFNEIIKRVKNIQDKTIQFQYFAKLMQKVEAFMENFNYHKPKKTEESAKVRTMLKKLKRLHFDINYKPGCMIKINFFIRSVGGTVITKAQMQEDKNKKLLAATEKLKAGEKMPRKKKKSLLGLLALHNNQK